MKPLRMRMQAFGPYAESAEVDFRDLSNGGLFLIHGPTGAGKTSILDGLCFSLFGRSSGSERAPENLRCDRSRPDLPTEAQLEFALGAAIYRVIRRPRQSVKKQRGEGMTATPAKGELFQLSGDNIESDAWTLVASGDKKTDEKITELLGMNEEQFRQVVVLPQGQFRKFLSSSSDEREELLETLFRTEHYRALTEKLQARASAMAGEISTLKQGLTAQLTLSGCESLDDLRAHLAELEERANGFKSGERNLNKNYDEAHARRDVARTAARDRLDLVGLVEKSRDLEVEKPRVGQISVRLEDDKRSRAVLTVDHRVVVLERNVEELRFAQTDETARSLRLRADSASLQTKKTELALQLGEIEKLKSERLQLQQVYTNANKLKTETLAAEAATQSLHTAKKSAADLEVQMQEAKSARLQTQNEAHSLESAVSGIGSLRLGIQKLNGDQTNLTQLLKMAEQLTFRRAQTTQAVTSAETKFKDEKTTVDRLKLNFHLSQAALLAKTLKPDEPCPVCGSADHPRPAVASTGVLIHPEDVEKAEAKLRAFTETLSSERAKLTAIEDELSRLSMPIDTARAQLDGIHVELEKSLTDLKNLEAKEKLLVAAKQTLRASEESITRLEITNRTATELREAAAMKAEARLASVRELENQVPENLRDLNAITARGQGLKARIETFTIEFEGVAARLQKALEETAGSTAKAESLAKQMLSKENERVEAADQRTLALKASGFATLETARASGLSVEQARDLEKTKKIFDEEFAVVTSRITDLKNREAEVPSWAHDLEACEKIFAELHELRQKRSGEVAAVTERLSSMTALEKRARALQTEMQALEEKFRTIGKLSAVANGQPPHNLSRVNFPRFVLAARLDEVLDQASRRLFLMSRGQFLLRRSKSVDDKRRNAGLDLEVEDSFTGTSRPTSSLSGGEGFLASLSLALGLADVVQSRLGGVRLDAVFVDEGFGTLDAEALELAIKTLAELQAGGRIVGIISHVPELRDQIARRLHVRKSATGSEVGWDNHVG